MIADIVHCLSQIPVRDRPWTEVAELSQVALSVFKAPAEKFRRAPNPQRFHSICWIHFFTRREDCSPPGARTGEVPLHPPLCSVMRRWVVERLFAWLHWFRRLVVRYEFHAENFLGMVRLGCMKIVLRYL